MTALYINAKWPLNILLYPPAPKGHLQTILDLDLTLFSRQNYLLG